MLKNLTKREVEILKELANGQTITSTAIKFSISRFTVKTHAEHIRYKLKARTIAHAVNIAYEERIFKIKNE